MKRLSVKAPAWRRGPLARLLAGLLAVALMAVLCPMGSIPAQGDTVPTLYRKSGSSDGSDYGTALGEGVTKAKVRTITFQNSLPDEDGRTCWDAGGGNASKADATVRGCATESADDDTMWDVVYGADSAYPAFPANSSFLFHGFSGLVSFVGLDQVDTSSVTSMAGMFSGCESLSSLDLSGFDTSRVTSTNQMFFGCESLSSLDLSGFDTSKVTNMGFMFWGCLSLSSLDFASWAKFDTSSVTYMRNMFAGCWNLSSLDLSGFDTSKVTDMGYMFYRCLSLSSLDLSGFDTSKVTDSYNRVYMLSGLSKLVELRVGANFTKQLKTDCYLGEPDGSAKASGEYVGYVNIGKWRDMTSGEVYASASEMPSSRDSVVTYTPFAPAYTVEFEANAAGASGEMDPQEFVLGVEQALSKNQFSRAGYAFKEWNTKRDGSGDSYADQAVMNLKTVSAGATVSLYAQWTAVDNAVTFAVGADGVLADGVNTPLSVKTGEKISTATGFVKPDVTANTGKRFLGWKSSVDGGLYQPDEIGALAVSSAVTFTAQYEDAADVSVLFDFAGGKDEQGNAYVKLTGKQGATYVKPDNPTREGYTFSKWDKDPSGKYETAVTYTAQWTANDNTVTFAAGDHGSLSSPASYTVKTGGKVSSKPTVSAEAGYTFVGWKSSEDNLTYADADIANYALSGKNGTVTFTAQYVANVKCTVVFNANGGLIAGSDAPLTLSDLKGKTYTKPADADLTREGYTFKSWDKAPSGTFDTEGVTVFTAQWTAKDNAVAFDAGTDGKLNANVKSPLSVKTDQTISTADGFVQPDVTANAGKRFLGWKSSADNGLYQPSQIRDLTVTSGVAFTAVYEDASGSVSVVFDYAGGADKDGKSFAVLTGQQGATYDKPANPTREGYTFKSWDQTPSGKYESAATYTAQWTANSYTVRFNANNGSGSMKDQSFKYDTAQNLTGNAFTRAGWTFAGWNTRADGKGTAYTDKQSVKNLTAKANDTVALYAQWTQSQSQGQMTRLSGEGRYDTMGQVVSQAYSGTAKTVIIASGANYPDALAASGLSGVLDAPIVLTDPNTLSSQAVDQLKRLKPSKIIIAGGVNAVSANVATQLKSYAGTVTRQGGATRYDTSYLLYEQGGSSWGTTAIVATGAGYADALSVSSYAYAGKAPVFLCDPANGLTAKQRTALGKFSRVVVVGGVNAVPAKYVSGLPGVTRLSGAGRYETSVTLAKWTQQNGLTMDGVVYATGENFPDALVSGPLAGRNKAPVLLASEPTGPAVSYSAGFKGKVTKAYAAGGTTVVSAATANALADALGISRP